MQEYGILLGGSWIRILLLKK